jgi:hypothetical protein
MSKYKIKVAYLSFLVARQPKSGLGRLLLEVSKWHSGTPHPVGLLWTSDRSVAETKVLLSLVNFNTEIGWGDMPKPVIKNEDIRAGLCENIDSISLVNL